MRSYHSPEVLISRSYQLLLLSLLVLGTVGAQTASPGCITGNVIDVESNQPLENVIVFLSNTPFGSSTGKDGTFRIANIPAATYELVVSRIGYDRQTLALQIAKGESLYYEIKLRPRPLRSKEVEILGERPEVPKPHIKYRELFFPLNAPDTYCIYGNGSTIPIGVFFADSGLYMYAIDTAIIDSEKYIRLWLLYKNLSQTPYDLNPMKCTRLEMIAMNGNKRSYKNIRAAPPGKIVTAVQSDEALDLIVSTIGGQLEALATNQSKNEWEEYRHYLLGTMKFRGIVPHYAPFGPAREGSLSADLHTVFANSVNDGILKRHVVYPQNSVHGYIYFPFPGLNWKAGSGAQRDALEYRYVVAIETPNESKVIEFLPAYGE